MPSAFFSSLLMFDMPMVCFTLLVLTGWASAWRGMGCRGWVLAGTGLGLELMTKGPVIFTFTLAVALGARWWMAEPPERGWRSWYLGVLGAIVVGASLCLAWLLPAACSGGETYRHAILWDQTAGRRILDPVPRKERRSLARSDSEGEPRARPA